MTITVFGGAEVDGGRRWYQSDESGPAGQVLDRYQTGDQLVERWIVDSSDGFLQAVATESVPDRTQTVFEVDGSERAEPYAIRHSLAVFRHGGFGAAVFWRRDGEFTREWLSRGSGAEVGGWETGWLDYPGPIPAEAVVPVDKIAEVLREFVSTQRQPTCVPWVEQPVETYGDDGMVIGWALGGRLYEEKPTTRW